MTLHLRTTALVLLLSLLLAACAGGRKLHFAQEGATPSPAPDVPRGDFLEDVWRFGLDGSFDAETGILRPVADGDLVIVAGSRGRVSALDLNSGEVRWETLLEMPLSAGVGAGDGLVMVATGDGDVFALKREDGSEAWRARVGGEVLAPPVIASGVAVVRAGDARIVGLDTATGELLWSVQKAIEGLTLRGTSKPLLNGRGIVAGLADGRLLAIDIDRGRILWETAIGTRRGANEVGRLADIDADPALLGTILYVASFQSRVVAMALGSPRVIWSNEISTLKNFGLDADHLYVTDDLGIVSALNRYTGELVWRQDQLSGRGLTGPLAVGDSLLVGDYEGLIHRLDTGSGAIRASRSTPGGAIVGHPVLVDDLILVTSERGRIHALRMR